MGGRIDKIPLTEPPYLGNGYNRVLARYTSRTATRWLFRRRRSNILFQIRQARSRAEGRLQSGGVRGAVRLRQSRGSIAQRRSYTQAPALRVSLGGPREHGHGRDKEVAGNSSNESGWVKGAGLSQAELLIIEEQ